MTYEEQYFKQTNEQKLKAQQMETIKSTLDGSTPIDKDSVYLIDWSKLQKIEDLITILASVGFSFSPMHPQFGNIAHLLDLSRPIKIGQPQAATPEPKDLKLPKLKVVKKDGE